MPRVNINLDQELYDRLEAAVGTSDIEGFIEEAIIERLEDFADEEAGPYVNGEEPGGLVDFEVDDDDEDDDDEGGYADDRD